MWRGEGTVSPLSDPSRGIIISSEEGRLSARSVLLSRLTPTRRARRDTRNPRQRQGSRSRPSYRSRRPHVLRAYITPMNIHNCQTNDEPSFGKVKHAPNPCAAWSGTQNEGYGQILFPFYVTKIERATGQPRQAEQFRYQHSQLRYQSSNISVDNSADHREFEQDRGGKRQGLGRQCHHDTCSNRLQMDAEAHLSV